MPDLVKQPTLAPTRKVTGGAAIGIPSGIVLVYILNTFLMPLVSPAGGDPVTIPGEVAAAIGSILSFIASYFVKERA